MVESLGSRWLELKSLKITSIGQIKIPPSGSGKSGPWPKAHRSGFNTIWSVSLVSGSGRHSKLKPISLPQGILWHPTLQGSLAKASRGSGTWGHPGAHWPAPVEERGAQEADYCCWLTRHFFCRIEAGLQSGADAWLKMFINWAPRTQGVTLASEVSEDLFSWLLIMHI